MEPSLTSTVAAGTESQATGLLVKRHLHDLRNSVNGIELELALLAETTDLRRRSIAIDRIRREMKTVQAGLRSFAAKFFVEPRMPIPIADVAEQWMADARALHPEAAIQWEVHPGGRRILTEPELLRGILGDMLRLAIQQSSGSALECRCAADRLEAIFSVGGDGSCLSPTPMIDGATSDPQSAPGDWARLEPYATRAGATLQYAHHGGTQRFRCRLFLSLLGEPGDYGQLAQARRS